MYPFPGGLPCQTVNDRSDTLDPYVVLGVEPTASHAQIRSAHRAIMRRVHPDVTGNSPAAAARAVQANAAWAVLKDPGRRAVHDRRRVTPVSVGATVPVESPAPFMPSWGPGGVRPVTVQQLRDTAERERAYSEVGRLKRAAFSVASRRIGLAVLLAGAVLLGLIAVLTS